MNPSDHSWLQIVMLNLWQATLFGLAIGVVIVLLPGPARLRHFAGWLGLLRFVLPAGLLAPLLASLPWVAPGGFGLPARLDALWLPAFIVSGQAGGAVTAADRLPVNATVLVLIWAWGATLLLAVGLIRLARGLRAVTRQAIPFAAAERSRLEALARRMGLRPGRVTGCRVPPGGWLGVIGLFRSRIVVPEGLFSALDDQEVDAVLLHELMHVKRRDNLLRLCQAGLVGLFWFHPLVWWLDRRLRWESERACDEGVLRLTGANHVYASSLFKAMRFALGLDLPGVSGMSRMRLHTRLQAVLHHQNRKDSPVKLALIAAALVSLLGLATSFATPSIPSAEGPPVADPPRTALEAGDPAKSPVYQLSELDQIPVPRKQVQPLYPAELKKAGVKGEAVISWVLDEAGDVGDAKVEQATDPRFGEAALEAVRQWKFHPGMKGGKPVKVLMKVPIVFSFNH